jgi:hypothetical protein
MDAQHAKGIKEIVFRKRKLKTGYFYVGFKSDTCDKFFNARYKHCAAS